MAEEKKLETEKVEHSNIYSALSGFQGELEPIEHSAKVQFRTKAGDTVDFSYAPLGKIMEKIYPLLARHGLSVRWALGDGDIECIVNHKTSEEKHDIVEKEVSYHLVEEENKKDKEIERRGFVAKNEIRSGKLPIKTKSDEMKDVGGQITYARRYLLGMVLGLSTEEDKDASLMEKSRQNTEKFAFTQAKKKLEEAKGEDLDKQLEFLRNELTVAEAIENKSMPKEGIEVVDTNGKTVKRSTPVLGLDADKYRELVKFGEETKKAEVEDKNKKKKNE